MKPSIFGVERGNIETDALARNIGAASRKCDTIVMLIDC